MEVEEGHLSKIVQVRSNGEKGETHREQEGEHPKEQYYFFFISLYTLFSYSSISSDILRPSLCPALCSKKGLKDVKIILKTD